MPWGADSVVPQELVVFENGTAYVARPIAFGKNVFRRGEDMRAGDLVLRAGTRLHGSQMAVLSALGFADVSVFRRPVVAVIACGDELLELGRAPLAGRVADTNSYMLAAEIDELGATAERRGIIPDDPHRSREALRLALDADAVVTCGGISVGERDFVRESLRHLGARFAFETAPISPGHPVSVAFVGNTPVFALPGTPGACRIAFEAFVRPALLKMAGAASSSRPRVWARLSERIEVRPGRTRFIWATLDASLVEPVVTPLPDRGTSTIRSASDANALIVLQPHAAAVEAGLGVEVWRLGEPPICDLASLPRAAVAIVGAKNAGKTTLVERLIPAFCALGVRVGTVKRHGHMTALDDPQKDTGRAATAGAAVTMLTGARGSVERRAGESRSLQDALSAMHGVDFALVEGYADSTLGKIRVMRHGIMEDRSPPAPPIVACVGDLDLLGGTKLGAPGFSWTEIERLADYLVSRFLG